MSKIIEASELPEKEKIYLRKDFLGYRLVYPIKNDDGSINFFNLLFGGKRNLVFILIILIIFLLFYFGYKEMNSNLIKISKDPCSYCTDCQQQTRAFLNKYGDYYKLKINFSNLDNNIFNYSVSGVDNK